MGRTHRMFGAYVGAGAAFAVHMPVGQALLAAAVSATVAGGRLSPDIDNYPGWKTLDRYIPDELLGRNGPMQHRGITHFWGNLVILALVVASLQLMFPSGMWFVAWHVLIGWASHLVGDFMFGKQVWGQKGHGIPMLPWWGHKGLGLDCGGRLESCFYWLMAWPTLLIPRRRRRRSRQRLTQRVYVS